MLYYKPKGQHHFAGDVIPFYDKGVYHIFYLFDTNHHQLRGGRHEWAHISTTDFREFQEHPMALRLGAEGECDSASCGTGCVWGEGDRYHLYYLGRFFATNGEKRETICHAVSTDLERWVKDAKNPVAWPGPQYKRTEWRDPFVRRDGGGYEMLVTAEHAEGPEGHRGTIALLRSEDLCTWRPDGDYWNPGTEIHYECPHLLSKGAYEYLFYSVGGSKMRVFYRKRRKGDTQWRSPRQDYFDGAFFYAGKPVSDGERIFLVGFVPYRNGNEGCWMWGGNIGTLELKQEENGDLRAWAIPEREAKRVKALLPECRALLESWSAAGAAYRTAPAGCSLASFGSHREGRILRCRFSAGGPVKRLRFYVKADGDLRNAVRLELDFYQNQILSEVLEQGVRKNAVMVNACLDRQEYTCHILIEDSIVSLVVDGVAAVTNRVFLKTEERVYLEVEEGNVLFWELDLYES